MRTSNLLSLLPPFTIHAMPCQVRVRQRKAERRQAAREEREEAAAWYMGKAGREARRCWAYAAAAQRGQEMRK